MTDKDKKIREYLDEKINEYDKILKSFYEEHWIEELALKSAFKPEILSVAAEAKDAATQEEAKAEILTQVILLNQLYSIGLQQNPTNNETKKKRKAEYKETIDVKAMTDRIYDNAKELEKCIKEGDPKAVEIIRNDNSEKYKDAYSFATKYCSFSNPEKYPIVDQYVKKMLKGLLGSGVFDEERFKSVSGIRKGALDKNYGAFVKVHKAFQKYIRETANSDFFSCKYTDIFLWNCGKEY